MGTLGRSLKELFEKSLRTNAHRTAIEFDGQAISYAAIDEVSLRLAAGLARLGVTSGDRVALLMTNRPEYLICDMAIMRLGAVKVPLNEMLSAQDVAYMLEHSAARAVIVGAPLHELSRSACARLSSQPLVITIEDSTQSPTTGLSFETVSAEADPQWLARVNQTIVPPDAAAVIYYTGGTTGRPKGVLHSQQGFVHNLLSHIIETGISQEDRLLLTTPLPHAAGLFSLTALARGATIFLERGFNADAALEAIETRRITWTFLVPTMLYRLLDSHKLGQHRYASLHTVLYGAAPITAERLREALDVFGPIFIQLYAQTECPNFGTVLSKSDHVRSAVKPEILQSCGQAAVMADVRIVDADGAVLPPDSIGEVCLRAPYTMQEYYREPELTRARLDGEWLRTGDIGVMDEEGYVYLKDRRNDMVISGGMNVYTTEVERVLEEYPGVRQAAVIGIPHPDWGEAVHALVVVGDASVTEADLATHCAGRLAKYMRPKSVSFVDALPLTAYGKIDKKQIRAPFWDGSTRQIH